MFTILSHCVYAGLVYYGLKVSESYQAQVSLAVPRKQALKNALLWPKNLLK
jgi:hypothetical protein